MCCIKMVEEKGEINTWLVGLNKLFSMENQPLYLQPRALASISVAVGPSFSTSACGFITSALRLNHYSTLFVAVSLQWVTGKGFFCLVLTSTAPCGPSSSDDSSWGNSTHSLSHEPQYRHTVHRHGEVPLQKENGKSKKGGM